MGSRGSRFYFPSHTISVIESDRATYFEDDTGTSQGTREFLFKEHPFFILLSIASTPIASPIIDQHPVATTDDEPIEDVDPVVPYADPVSLDVVMNIPLRRSERARRLAILDDYFVYLQENEYDVGCHTPIPIRPE